MKFRKICGLALLAAAMAFPANVSAQAFSGPVALNAFISFGGLDWAWASPCYLGADDLDSCQSEFVLVDGFRYASADEWAARPDPSAFLDPAGNFGGNGGPMRCASGWFNISPVRTHCDYNDATSGYLSSGTGNYGSQGFDRASESWLVRGEQVSVPEPASALLLLGGLGLMGFVRGRDEDEA